MPHDSNGDELQADDIVTVRFRVTQVYSGETACNVSLVGADVIEGEIAPPTLTTNTKFTTKTASA